MFMISGITLEENLKSYAKYYNMDMSQKPKKSLDKIYAGEINPKYALKIEDINDLLNPGYLPTEEGYCIMPDGSGFVANLTKMPYVTPEMFDWWFAWYGLDSLRYKIWNKENHYTINTTNREQLLSSDLSLKHKLWGVTYTAIQDIGLGLEKVTTNFLSPVEMGFDIHQFKEPYVSSVVGGNTEKGVMCHFIRKIEDGIEVRSRYWIGYKIVDKKPVKMLPNGVPVAEESAKLLALHTIKEYSNLAKLLPKIYYEERNNWE